MKRLTALVLVVCMAAALLAGCSSSKSYTFKVSTGDDIKVILDTSEGHELSQEDGTFYVSLDDEDLIEGIFFEEDVVEEYLDTIPSSDEVEILAEGSNGYGDYIFYAADDEWYYVVMLDGTDTGIGITGFESEKETVECIELLSFACEDEDVEPSDEEQLPDYGKKKDKDRKSTKDETVPEETKAAVKSTEPAQTLPAETEPVQTKPVSSDADLPETVIYDENNIKITVTDLSYEEDWGYSLYFYIENNSDQNITFTSDQMAVNGITMDVFTYISVNAGKKANEEAFIYEEYVTAANITQIASIDCWDAYIYDSDSYEDLYDVPFTIVLPGMENYEQPINSEGVTLVDQDGVKIVAQELIPDGYDGYYVTMYLENSTGKKINVEADGVYVNGFMTDGWMYQNLYADTVGYGMIDISSTDLETNNITDITEVAFSIEVLDLESYETILETDEITLTID